MARYGWAARIRPQLATVGLSLGFFATMALVVLPARAGAPVETFVQQNVDRGVQILKDKTLSDEERRKEIRDLLTTVVDARKIGLFALGAARDTASQADLDAYSEAFKAFITASYESQLDGYGGQSLKVTGSVERAPGDEVVTAVLVDPANPADNNPVRIMFRVLDENGKLSIVDASIAGVWLGLAQRDDFGGFLGQHGGSVPALTDHLKEMTAKLTAPKAAATAP